ncbi:hypothetical protein R6Q59_024036 [Mikania micrantha]
MLGREVKNTQHPNHSNSRFKIIVQKNALVDAGIITFLDDEEIETGEHLKPELERAIRSSRASVIILSKNYASSTWCMDELVLILDQKRNRKQIVIPIFYHVDPTQVRKQQDSFGEAMAEYKKKMEREIDVEKRSQFAQKMKSWKMALTQVADLKEKMQRAETECIEEVVADIHRRVCIPLSNTLPRLIGMDYQIEFISSWLTDGSCHTTDILTIVGIGGIGKTSLARHVFGLHFSKFDKSSFIERINAKANEHFNGLLDLQKQLHGDISKKIELQVNDVIRYTSTIENVLARKRVFIVLDDIDSLKQLDALLGNKGLHPGSKVIITTKDASLTKGCALFKSQVYPNHKEVLLNGLYKYDSLKLLCIHAFDSQNPKEGYEVVSKKFVKYCNGLPLAIEVLGRSLQKQDVAYWEECIKLLKREPHSHINKALKMSFDALLFENDKESFKHIACFFVGKNRDVTETILNSCDLNARSAITNLVDRCLLCIGWNNELIMHQLVQEMGRDLVHQESPVKPWKRSRSWCHAESFKVLKQKKAKGNMLGLALDMKMLDKKMLHGSFKVKTESFGAMDNLMLLQLNYVQLNGCFKNFPEELRWLCMHGSPLKSIPLDLPMEKLVVLDMSYSNVESLDISKNKRFLGSLKILDLSFCEQLHSVGGFFLLPALERLILRNCIGLIEVCESVKQCDELVHIDLSYCYKLRKLPKSLGKLTKIKTLLLDGCNSRESQIEMGNVKVIPSDLKFSMIPLLSSLRILSLANNNLSNKCFPMDLSCLAMLEELRLDRNPIVSMPSCVRTLPRLKRLHMNNCYKVMPIEDPPSTLRELSFFLCQEDPLIREINFDREMSPLNLREHKKVSLNGINEDESLKLLCIHAFKSNRPKQGYIEVSENLVKYCQGHPLALEVLGRSLQKRDVEYWEECIKVLKKEPDSRINKALKMSFDALLSKNDKELFKHIACFFVGIDRDVTETILHSYGEERRLCYLSHWMFGPNEMKAGDHITIVLTKSSQDLITLECGIGLVYDDGSMEEEEDVLGYYKSWNHIIGGDLSHFQTKTGEYDLDNTGFWQRFSNVTSSDYLPFIDDGSKFKRTYYLLSNKRAVVDRAYLTKTRLFILCKLNTIKNQILIFFISTLKLSFNNSSPSMITYIELLPSSSSSTHDHDHDQHRTYEYDVFLSFRGADTRYAFTDHLYHALLDAGIKTFLDDEEIETGEPLKPELEGAIKSSRASIIILSENYASSTWCLDELVLILHQKNHCNQIVIPIFYHVEPTDVRKQLNSFEEAMAKHKQKMDSETNEEKRSQLARKMESWKRALTEIADLKGKDVKKRKETEFIKEVVDDIHRRLRVPLSYTLPCLIGMNSEIRFICSWLRDGSCNTAAADILTVVGMGGIGKTSLAKYVFQLHSYNFDKSSFIEGIDAKCKENLNGMLDLQKQLLGDISKAIGRKKDKGNLLGLSLDMRMLDKNKTHELEANSLSRMDNLMLLKLNYVLLNECFQSFPNELRWLCMHGFPLKSIHLDIPMENLVALDMSCSNIESFGMSYNNHRRTQKIFSWGAKIFKNQLLRSLKILDLSFCEQLHSVGGFFLLPVLERLILRYCTSLVEVCESIEQCDDLVQIDLSYCHKLRKLPKSLGKLTKVKTLLLDGCNFGESHNEMGNAKAIPNDLKFIMIPLPSSLTMLSLADNNLSNECFPMDFSCLAMLKELCLDNNPIVSMPSCVRTLTRLEILHMRCCYKMISIENPPRTLLYLCLHSGHYNSTKKIKFDSEMRPLLFDGIHPLLSTLEIDGMLKTQGMTSVEEKVLSSLGWTNLDFTKESLLDPKFSQPQMHYEFGIFSFFYYGKEMPKWINCRRKGPSISFTIPSSCNNLQGLNFCCVEKKFITEADFAYWSRFYVPYIRISNITKNHTWIYQHYIHGISEDLYLGSYRQTFECGIRLVYDEDGKNEEEKKEDVLGYYKSWNHIIGGDLSPFQTTTGEYLLNHGLKYEFGHWYYSIRK